MNLKGSIKDCFWIKNELTNLGLNKDTFKFIAIEDSSVTKILKEENWLNKASTSTPFCVGVLDPSIKQKSGIYAGASSSGSVIDVESQIVDFAICTDTGGSTIAPSARANLYGFKPTYGRISRYGLNPLCSCLDVISLMSSKLEFIKTVYKKIDVPDFKDDTCIPLEERVFKNLNKKIKIPANLFSDLSIKKLLLKYPTAELVNFPINYEILEGAYFYILCPDFFSNMAKFDGINHKFKDSTMGLEYHIELIKKNRSELSTQIKSRIFLGAKLLENNYDYHIIDKFKFILNSLLKEDLWIFPISPTGELYSNNLKHNSYCLISNITGRPSITYPNDIMEGYFLISPKNTDYDLLDFIGNN